MTDSVQMQLVFRLAGIGFVLPIGDLVEVREAATATGAGVVDDAGDPMALTDLRARLGLPAAKPTHGPLLVLCGRSRPWVLAVDSVEGIFPGGDFSMRPLPALLAREAPGTFRELAVWREEPLQVCNALQLEQLGRGA